VAGFCEDDTGERLVTDDYDATGAGGQAACSGLPNRAAAPEIHEGNYLVTDASSIDAAARLTHITGDLDFGTRAVDLVKTIRLPLVERIDGSVRLAGPSVERVELPNLLFVGGDLDIALASSLLESDLRQLSEVAGDVTFRDNAVHERLRLDSLTEVGGTLLIDDPELSRCEVEATYLRVGLGAPEVGRDDCECQSACEWLEVSCP
jgi:hypothetical protein